MEQKSYNELRPLVTIGLPVYNSEKYIRLAIQSILNQTYKNWRLIIINDGSTDSSENIIKEFLSDKRITLISEKNRGLTVRLNQLVDLCETKYYFRMDSDDIMHPERLQRQIEVMEENAEIDVLGSNAFTIDDHDLVVGVRLNYDQTSYLRKVKSFIHPTIMGKTQWFRNNRYDEDALRIEDAELWYRTADKSNFMIITRPLFFYRDVGQNYYRKYFKIQDSKEKIIKKYGRDYFWKKFFVKNAITGLIYRIFNVFNSEQVLVNKRNKITFNERLSYENYIN